MISHATARLLAAALAWAGGARAAADAAGGSVTIGEIAAGIEVHIAARSRAAGGFFPLPFQGRTLQLELVRVHLEYLADLGGGVHFACVDLVGRGGNVYDVDFFLRGAAGAMAVTETTVHKVNGQPLYVWEQQRDGTWRRVAVKDASERLLGVIRGQDEFDFTYRVRLPRLAGPAQLWLPLARSNACQDVTVRAIRTPAPWRRLDEHKYGNQVLYLTAGPADSGRTVEVQYHVRRREQAPYAAAGPVAPFYLDADRLAPTNAALRDLALTATRDQPTELRRARALYDLVIARLRYAKYGAGWGCGDATYACRAGHGNCSDFHALFIALARSVGIPARFAVGAAIPSERNDGGCDGYHCWAEFFAAGKWWPVDLSEANKNFNLASYYFGHQPANRFELSQGRDLVVEPGPAAGPINFLAFPVLEVAGRPVPVPAEFLFRRPGRG